MLGCAALPSVAASRTSFSQSADHAFAPGNSGSKSFDGISFVTATGVVVAQPGKKTIPLRTHSVILSLRQ